MSSSLTIKNLTIVFSRVQRPLWAIKDLSFSLSVNQRVGVIGESGCGKSSLLKAIVQLLPACSKVTGQIFYGEKKLLTLSAKEMEKIRAQEIALVPQESINALNPMRKVSKQLADAYYQKFPFASSQKAYLSSVEMLKELGFTEPEALLQAYPYQLSGGMQQRVLIAIALLRKPKILLADEPTTALDKSGRLLALESILRHSSSSILVSHDLESIIKHSQQIIVMYEGQIVEVGETKAVVAAPAHPYTKALFNCQLKLPMNKREPLHFIATQPLKKKEKGCPFAPSCPQAMAICRRQTPPFYSLGKEQSSACFLYDKQVRQEKIF